MDPSLKEWTNKTIKSNKDTHFPYFLGAFQEQKARVHMA